MKAVIIGATGATGKELVKKLIDHPDCEEIRILVRKLPETNHPKVIPYLVDFSAPESWQHLVQGDSAYSCLGTTLKDAGSKEAQYQVDFTYQYQFAEAARQNEIPELVLISAYGASSKSHIFYSRMKGKLEEAVERLNFPTLVIFRPGMLDRNDRSRANEASALRAIYFLNKLGLFRNLRPLPVSQLAQAMVNLSLKSVSGTTIISGSEIFDAASENNTN